MAKAKTTPPKNDDLATLRGSGLIGTQKDKGCRVRRAIGRKRKAVLRSKERRSMGLEGTSIQLLGKTGKATTS